MNNWFTSNTVPLELVDGHPFLWILSKPLQEQG